MKNTHTPTWRTVGAALLMSLMLTACLGGDDPAEMIAQAKTAIDKRDFNLATIQVKNVLQKDDRNAEARFLFGRILLEQADPAGAEREFRKAIEAGHAKEQAAPLIVRAMTEAGEGKKALAEFVALRFEKPEAQAELLTALGRASFTLGDRDGAMTSFEQALQAQPAFVPAQLGKAGVLAMKQDFDGALVLVDKAIAADASNADAMLLKGDLLSARRDADGALAAFTQAVKAKPDAIRAHQRLVSFLIAKGDIPAATTALAEMKKIAPNNLPTVYLDALLNLRQNQFAKARDVVANVLKVAPNHVPSLIVNATSLMRLGDHLQAQTQLEKLISLDRDSSIGRKLLAESFIAVRDSSRALDALKPLLANSNADPEVLDLAGQAHLLAGDNEKSAEYFARLTALKPDSAEARTRLGLARLSAGGDDAAALQDLEAATKMEGSTARAELALISAHLRKGDVAKALASVAELEKKQPDSSLTYNVKGGVLLASKDVPGARKAFERALELQPGNIGAAAQLARLDLADKKLDEAKKRFERIIEKEPKNTRAYLMLAQLHAETGSPPKDLQAILERAVAADPSQNEAKLALVQLFLKMGDTKRALELAQQAQAASPDNYDILRALGRTQMQAGEKQQAISTFGKLQAAQPQNPAALIELADAQRATNDLAGAEQSLRKALALKNDLIEAQQRLAGLLLADKRTGDALQLAREIQKQRPDSPIGFAVEADIHSFEKKWPNSMAALQQAYKRAKNPQLLMAMYNVSNVQGKKAEGDKLVADWMRENPKDATVRAFLAERALATANYAEAAMHYRDVLKLTPNQPLVLNNLAWASHKAGDAQALAYAEAAYKLAPKLPDVQETLGSILVDRGQLPRGLEMLKQAAAASPKSPVIHYGYARALAKSGDKATAKKEAELAATLAPEKSPLRGEIEKFAQSL